MMTDLWMMGAAGAGCLAAALARAFFGLSEKEKEFAGESPDCLLWSGGNCYRADIQQRRCCAPEIGMAQTTGNMEIQSDVAASLTSDAGTMAALADGIGKHGLGKLCAQIAVDTILDRYEPYQNLQRPEYFFKTAFYEANHRIQETAGNQRGGANTGAVFLGDGCLHYGLAGNIKIALFRNGELIPISRGQTVDVLAEDAWKDGKLSRQEMLWSLEDRRIWNYVGMDGFHEIETCQPPVKLRRGDVVLLASKGIFETLSWAELEDVLEKSGSVQELAEKIILETEKKVSVEKDNGSIMLFKIRGWEQDAKD